MASADVSHRYDYLLIGGGLAAASAAEELRKRDDRGRIAIVAGEPELPYHRPPLSKEYLRGEIQAEGIYGKGGVYVQPPEWYERQRVAVLRGVTAVALDAAAKTARLADGRELGYGALLLATGGRPRPLDVPGIHLPNVYALRTLADSGAIRDALAEKARRVVVLGSGFIGMEAAAQALFRGAHVAIVDPAPSAWAALLPPALGSYFQQQFARRGAAIYYGHAPTAILADAEGNARAVTIHSVVDESITPIELPCDLVVVGVGITLNSELAARAGLRVDPRHGIVVDEWLRASAPDVYAAGDVIAYPDPIVGRMHFEHWDHAIASGQAAAANMTGANEPYHHVPYFFSDQFDLSINMLGYPSPTAQIAVRGQPQGDQLTALFVESGILRAALMVNDDAQMDLLREHIAAQVAVPDVAAAADPAFDLAQLAKPAL